MSRRAVVAVLTLAGAAASAFAQEADGSKVYAKVVPSVVWVLSERPGGLATGSGSLIDKDRRLILTNYHVVEDQPRARVFFPEFRNGDPVPEKKYYRDRADRLALAGRVVARNKSADLALIQLDEVPKTTPAIPVSAVGAKPGQVVHSIGNAGASGALWGYVRGTVRQVYNKSWKVSVERRVLSFEAKVIETDSPTNPGDSGGPLVNDKGELVGVTQGGVVSAQAVSYFVDASEVRRLLDTDDAKRAKPNAPPAEPAAVKRDKPAAVSDAAKLFGAAAVTKAQAEVDALFKDKLDVLVETFPKVPEADLERVRKLPPAERTEYMKGWVRKRMADQKVTGFGVLICDDPKSLYVDVTGDATGGFPDKFALKVRDRLIAGLKADQRDEALLDALKMIRENLKK